MEKIINLNDKISSEDMAVINQIDFVLMKYTPEELKVQKANIDRAVDAIESIIKVGIDKTMNDYNGL